MKDKINMSYEIQLLRFLVSRGEATGNLTTESGNEWSESINIKERFEIQARDELQICAELENKYKFKLISVVRTKLGNGISTNEFYLKRTERKTICLEELLLFLCLCFTAGTIVHLYFYLSVYLT